MALNVLPASMNVEGRFSNTLALKSVEGRGIKVKMHKKGKYKTNKRTAFLD